MKVREITKRGRWRSVLRMKIDGNPMVILARAGFLRMRTERQ